MSDTSTRRNLLDAAETVSVALDLSVESTGNFGVFLVRLLPDSVLVAWSGCAAVMVSGCANASVSPEASPKVDAGGGSVSGCATCGEASAGCNMRWTCTATLKVASKLSLCVWN
jgi:hypothetical protein